MAKITRATQKIFGENAPTTAITTFGTAKATTPNNSRNPNDIQTAAYLTGWENALEADFAPFVEDTNGLCYLFTRQLAYLYQQGVSEWDAGTTYYKNSLCTVIENNNLVIKRSLTDNNINHNPVSDTTNWVDYFSDRVIHTIGDPIVTLNSVLGDNEIWLEGATVSRTTYSNLFQIYGTTYGAGNGSTTFKLPDFRNRAIWGANSFGYLAAGLPNITGYTVSNDGNVVYSPYATGYKGESNDLYSNGALYIKSPTSFSHSYTITGISNSNTDRADGALAIDASRSSSIYGNSTTVQPASIKVRVKTRYQ
ncbi:MAG: tail fiber protein [Lachnospiraceae bacterium]|nr:tail fiber protein [Lachnospiraceae bacterium]